MPAGHLSGGRPDGVPGEGRIADGRELPEATERSLPPKLREERWRRAAIEAVARLAHERADGSGFEQVAARSGIPPRFLGDAFGSESGLLRAACEDATRLLVDPVEGAGELEEPWPERVSAAIGGLFGAAAEEPLTAELCLMHVPRLLGCEVSLGRTAVIMAMARLIGDRGDVPCAREPPPLMDEFLAGGVVAALAGEPGGREQPPHELRADLVELTLAPVLGNGEARRFAKGLRRRR